jgi:nucleoid DNA-binding protein
MNKAELTKALARSSGLSQAYAGSALQAFQDVVIAELRKGGEVNITGFGKFSVTERARAFVSSALFMSILPRDVFRNRMLSAPSN